MNVLCLMMAAAVPMAPETAEQTNTPDVLLLDFYGNYCPPCRQMLPIVQRMQDANYPIRKVDITADPELSRQYRIEVIPTFVLLVEGREVARYTGAQDEAFLRGEMNREARKLEELRRGDPADSPLTAQASIVAEDALPGEDPADPFADADAWDTAESSGSDGFGQQNASARQDDAEPGAIANLLGRIRSGFGGSGASGSGDNIGHPVFRGQDEETPRPAAAPRANPGPMAASVRISVRSSDLMDSGSGTILSSVPGSTVILTCAHLFADVSGKAVVEVDVFSPEGVLTYPAEVLGGDHNIDLAVLKIRTNEALPTAAVLPAGISIEKGDNVFSIGCSEGADPTVMASRVAAVDSIVNAPSNLTCTGAPAAGRSGGGLFDAAGRLIGVCNFADRERGVGIYMARPAIAELMNRLQLQSVFPGTPAAESQQVADAGGFPSDTQVGAFEDTDDLFAQIFPEEPGTPASGSEPISPEMLMDTMPPNASSTGAAESATSASNTPARSAAQSLVMNRGPQVTVVIESPEKGRQVVVIPHASPYLLELLTGEPSQAGSDVVRREPVRGRSDAENWLAGMGAAADGRQQSSRPNLTSRVQGTSVAFQGGGSLLPPVRERSAAAQTRTANRLR